MGTSHVVVLGMLLAVTRRRPITSCGGRGTKYRGATMDLDVKDADIKDVFRLLADVGKVNLVVPDDVSGRVTLRPQARAVGSGRLHRGRGPQADDHGAGRDPDGRAATLALALEDPDRGTLRVRDDREPTDTRDVRRRHVQRRTEPLCPVGRRVRVRDCDVRQPRVRAPAAIGGARTPARGRPPDSSSSTCPCPASPGSSR